VRRLTKLTRELYLFRIALARPTEELASATAEGNMFS
jgi:hypothetical protein